MIKPKYEIGYSFKGKRGNTYEVIDRTFDGYEMIYCARNIDIGNIIHCLEKDIDSLLGGANAKKPRKKQTRSLL